MLKVFLTVFLMTSAALALPNIPDGQYEGHAKWQDDTGNKGSYSISIFTQKDVLMTTYKYADKTAIYSFRIEETSNGFFNVFHNGTKVGSGYCMSVQCHYSADFGGVAIEESLTYWQNNLYRLGSKKVNGISIAWEEATKQVR